jgi:hypothetical protein
MKIKRRDSIGSGDAMECVDVDLSPVKVADDDGLPRLARVSLFKFKRLSGWWLAVTIEAQTDEDDPAFSLFLALFLSSTLNTSNTSALVLTIVLTKFSPGFGPIHHLPSIYRRDPPRATFL